MKEPELLPRILSPCSSGRRKSTDSNSPEFQFWTSFTQPNLLTADELFSGGVLLPLHRLNLSNDPPTPNLQNPEESDSGQPEPSTVEVANLSVTPALTSSKRWIDIFKKSDGNNNVKEKKREKKKNVVGSSSGLSAAAELNINIWPFSRSRSAGNVGTRPRSAAANRKVSSAPCSRSNSAGESNSRKSWPSSPNRAGVHLRRTSPVWQVRRSINGPGGKDANEGRRKIPSGGISKTRILSLNVPMCIGYRHHLSCRSDENRAISVSAAVAGNGGGADSQNGAGVTGEGVRGSNLFGIRNLFSKKVY